MAGWFTRLLAIASVTFFCTPSATAGTPKVLIIGIDGCRPDALLVAKAPNIETLWKQGSFSFHARSDILTTSGPCWSSLFTGVWNPKHGILDNRCAGRSDKYPTLFERVKEAKPELATAVFTSWPDILKLIPAASLDVALNGNEDDAKTREAIKDALKNRTLDVVFIQLDKVDQAGHKFGYGPDSPRYINAIEQTDADVGQIMDALKSRKDYENEDWLIILTTDHGGIRKKHGGNSPQESTIFTIFWGKSVVSGEIFEQPMIVDIAATAMAHLGMSIRPAWDLDGHAIPLNAPHEPVQGSSGRR